MKIEMAESLFYSWLRHIKKCQIAQTNWKTSPIWELNDEKKLSDIMNEASQVLKEKYNYNVFKKNASLSQLLCQFECDALGISVGKQGNEYYAVDVAFHEDSLLYGSKTETAEKVAAKMIKTALCLYGYFQAENGVIIFASPKISKSILELLIPVVETVNELFKSNGLKYKALLIANQDFQNEVLMPVLNRSEKVADSSELFMRSYQMLKLFN